MSTAPRSPGRPRRPGSRRRNSATGCRPGSAIWSPQLNATNDFFIRTTDPEHERRVQEFMVRLRDAGHLYEDTYAGLYCTGCEQFYAESDLEQPGNICPLHKTPVEWLEEENTFFRLSAFAEPLLELYDRDPEYVVPRTRYNEARSQIEAGLERPLGEPRVRQLGRAAAVGARADDLRLGRRAAQLPHGARVRPRPRTSRRRSGRSTAPAGEGHPAPARRPLAGAC